MEQRDRSPSRRLTPTGSNTSTSFKCAQCGTMYPAGDKMGASGCMVCPSCGFENCADDSTIVNASDEEY